MLQSRPSTTTSSPRLPLPLSHGAETVTPPTRAALLHSLRSPDWSKTRSPGSTWCQLLWRLPGLASPQASGLRRCATSSV